MNEPHRPDLVYVRVSRVLQRLVRGPALCRLAFALTAALPASAQSTNCGDWSGDFGPPGVAGTFNDFLAFDDGSGLAVYGAGGYVGIGQERIEGVARWDGVRWHAVGTGLKDVRSLAVFDDGAGPKLYAGGSFDTSTGAPANGIARWTGTSWQPLSGTSPLGSPGWVNVLQVHDDGTGPALYVGGPLSGTPGSPRLAKWKSSGWSNASAGLIAGATPVTFSVFDAGSGPALYVGLIGSPECILRWNGTSWASTVTTVTMTSNSVVRSLATYASSSGTHLYAAGQFGFTTGAPPEGILRYDGVSWSPVGGGLTGASPGAVSGTRLAVHDDGSGSQLYLGGAFISAGGVPAQGFATWDGNAWASVPSAPTFNSSQIISAMRSCVDGGQPALFVSGSFDHVGSVAATNVARLRNGVWSRVARGEGLSAQVSALHVFDDGNGPSLFAGGFFDAAGTTLSNGVVRWDGVSWHPVGAAMGLVGVGASLGWVTKLLDADLGSGPELYAGGSFTRIGGVPAESMARWNGSQWSALGTGVNNVVKAMEVFDDGTGAALYVAGQFPTAGGLPAGYIARWDGSSWSALGSGVDLWVNDIAVFDDGSGPALYACGAFNTAGGIAVPGIARWNGSSWSAVGNQIQDSNQMYQLQVCDDGHGSKLWLFGYALFQGASGLVSVATWDGSTWNEVNTPFVVSAPIVGVFDMGLGPRLTVAVKETTGLDPSRLWTWDGAQWTSLPGMLSGWVNVMTSFDAEHDGVPDLYVGGNFLTAGDRCAKNLARFTPCETQATVVCSGDGSSATCPCGNFGSAGSGCANSTYAEGALLESSGLASFGADTLGLHATRLLGPVALFAQADAIPGGIGLPFHDGLSCLGGTVLRLGVLPTTGDQASLTNAGGSSISGLGLISAPGQIRTYQAVYRDAATFCTPATMNATNGLTITWTL